MRIKPTATSILLTLTWFYSLTSGQITTSTQANKTLNNLTISADAAWVAAEDSFNPGSSNVRIWSTKNDIAFTIQRGLNPRFSRDSKWVTAIQKPIDEDSENANSNKKHEGQTLILLNLADGSKQTFEHVLSYDMTRFSSHLAYLQASNGSAAEKSKDLRNEATAGKHHVGTLRVRELISEREFTWQNVTQYAVHQTANPETPGTWREGYAYVAFVVRNKGTGHDRLQIAFVGHDKVGWGGGGSFDGGKVKDLCWAENSTTLAFVNNVKKTNDKIGPTQIESKTYIWHDIRGQSGHRAFTQLNQNQAP